MQSDKKPKHKIVFFVLALIFLLIVYSTQASAYNMEDNRTSCYTFESDATDSWNSYDFTNNGASFVTGIVGDGADFEASESDYMTQARNAVFETQRGTICAWLNVESKGANDRIIMYQGPTGNSKGWGIDMLSTSLSGQAQYDVSGFTTTPAAFGSPANGVWNFACYRWESGDQDLLINGSVSGSDTSTTNIVYDASLAFELGKRVGLSSDYYDGIIDEFMVWDDTIDDSELLEIYTNQLTCAQVAAGGASVPDVNESVERTTTISLPNTVTFNSANFQTIHSGIVTVENATNISITDSVNLIALSRDGDATCRITWDGVTYNTTKTRSMTQDAYGSLYITSSVFEAAVGNYTVALQCQRDTPGSNQISIVNSEIIIHELISGVTGEPINYVASPLSLSIPSTSYSQLWAYNFTTSDDLTSTAIRKHIILDGDLIYNYASTGTITTYLRVNGENFAEFPRYGTAGSTGSVGAIFEKIINPLSNASQTVNLSIWGKSTTGDGTVSGNAIVKEVVANVQELNTTSLNGSTVSSSSYIDVANLSIRNAEHASANLLVLAGIPIETTSSTTRATFRISVEGLNSKSTIRDVTGVNQAGVLIIQEVFNLTQGYYNITLQAQSNSSFDIVGGSMTGYITNRVEFTPTSYNVTAYNHFNNSIIYEFNVTNERGTIFTTTDGRVEVAYNSTLYNNLTISDGVYIPRTFLAHNTSTNLNVTLWQNELNVTAQELFSATPITSFNATLASVSNNSGADGIAHFYPNNATYTLSAVAAGYWPRVYTLSFGVLSYRDFTVNLSTLQWNITASFYGTPVNDFTTTIERLDGDYTQEETTNTTTGTAQYFIAAGQYNITLDSDGYASQSYIITFNSSQTFLQSNFSLLETNTLNISFFDAKTLAALSAQNITFEIIGETFSGNYSTSDGNLSLTLLFPQSYVMRYYSEEYPEHFYWFNLSNRTYNNLKLYMHKSTYATNVSLAIIDEFNDPAEGLRVATLRYDIVSNSFLLQEIIYTDFDGEAIFDIEVNAEYYKFFIYSNNVLIKTTEQAYITSNTLSLQVNILGLSGQDYFTWGTLTGSLVYDNTTDLATFTYSDSEATASAGCVELLQQVDGVETSINTTCTSGAAGTVNVPLTPANDTSYYFNAFINKSGIEFYMGSEGVEGDITGAPNYGTAALWLAMLVSLVLVFYGFTYGVSYGLLFLPIPLVILTVTNILNFSYELTAFITLVVWIVALGVLSD